MEQTIPVNIVFGAFSGNIPLCPRLFIAWPLLGRTRAPSFLAILCLATKCKEAIMSMTSQNKKPRGRPPTTHEQSLACVPKAAHGSPTDIDPAQDLCLRQALCSDQRTAPTPHLAQLRKPTIARLFRHFVGQPVQEPAGGLSGTHMTPS